MTDPSHNAPDLSRHWVPVLLLALGAVLLGMQGGTPLAHPDFLIDRAKDTLRQGGNPRFFNYPALMLYIHGFVYSAYELLLHLVPQEKAVVLDAWPYRNIPGHLVTVSFSALGVLSVYGSTFLLTRSRFFSFLAGFLLFSSPLWNADAHFITVDIPLAALASLTLFAAIYLQQTQKTRTWKACLVLGVLVGLTTSAKYNGALVSTSVAAVLILDQHPWRKGFLLLFACGAIALATFLLTNPFVIQEPELFLKHFSFELFHSSAGHHGSTVDRPAYHLLVSLRHGWGPLMLLSAVGASLLLLDKRVSRPVKAAFFAFPLLHFLMLLTTHLAFQRYAVPLLPALAIYAGVALQRIAMFAAARRNPLPTLFLHGAWITALIWGLWINFPSCRAHNRLLGRPDTRSALLDVSRAHRAHIKHLRIGAGGYTRPYLGLWKVALLVEQAREPQMLVLDSFTHERFIHDRRETLPLDFSTISGGRCVTLSPFSTDKAEVPYSAKSLYSPYAPDLAFRLRPGPYIEIYFSDASLAEHFNSFLQAQGTRSALLQVEDGYYHQELCGSTRE